MVPCATLLSLPLFSDKLASCVTSPIMGNTPSWTTASIGDSVTGKHIIVTGASSGIGLEAARVLALKGAHVTLAVRNEAKTAPLRDAIAASITSGGSVTIGILDLEDLETVRAFAAKYRAEHTSLDILVNNAGVMTPATLTRTKQGFDQQMGTNHYAHFMLTTELLPLLTSTPGSRIVNVSSLMHKHVPSAAVMKRNIDSEIEYEMFMQYGRSKLANLLFTFELQRRLTSAGLASPIVVASHPGYTETNLQFGSNPTILRGIYTVTNAIVAMPVDVGGWLVCSLE